MALFDRFKRKKVIRKEREAATSLRESKNEVKPNFTPKKEEEAKERTPLSPAAKSGLYADIILKPHVSEKSATLADRGIYVFDVPRSANKIEIAKAVHAIYSVDVEGVRTIRMKGKVLGSGRKRSGRRKDWKKALVELKKGQTLNLVEGV